MSPSSQIHTTTYFPHRHANSRHAAAGHITDAGQRAAAVLLRVLHLWHRWRATVGGHSAATMRATVARSCGRTQVSANAADDIFRDDTSVYLSLRKMTLLSFIRSIKKKKNIHNTYTQSVCLFSLSLSVCLPATGCPEPWASHVDGAWRVSLSVVSDIPTNINTHANTTNLTQPHTQFGFDLPCLLSTKPHPNQTTHHTTLCLVRSHFTSTLSLHPFRIQFLFVSLVEAPSYLANIFAQAHPKIILPPPLEIGMPHYSVHVDLVIHIQFYVEFTTTIFVPSEFTRADHRFKI